jgi:hypothetical protein
MPDIPLLLGSRTVPGLRYSNLAGWPDLSCPQYPDVDRIENTASHYCCLRSHYSVTAVSAAFPVLTLRYMPQYKFLKESKPAFWEIQGQSQISSPWKQNCAEYNGVIGHWKRAFHWLWNEHIMCSMSQLIHKLCQIFSDLLPPPHPKNPFFFKNRCLLSKF